MTDYEEIVSELPKLSPWARAAFAAGCAERVAPLVRHLNQPGADSTFQTALEGLYGLLTGAPVNVARRLAVQVRDFLEENSTDDSDSPVYYSSEAIGILVYAFEALEAGDTKPAGWASSAAMDIAGEVDNVMVEDWRTPVIIDPRNQPPPGPLEEREVAAQRESLRLLSSAREPDAELLGSLRRLSQEASRELDARVPEFARRMGWD